MTTEPEITYGNPDVNSIVETFADLFGSTKVTRYDRWAAGRMARSKHYGGAEGVVVLIKLFHSLSDDRYAPRVSSVSQFDDKLPAIVSFVKSKGQQLERIDLE